MTRWALSGPTREEVVSWSMSCRYIWDISRAWFEIASWIATSCSRDAWRLRKTICLCVPIGSGRDHAVLLAAYINAEMFGMDVIRAAISESPAQSRWIVKKGHSFHRRNTRWQAHLSGFLRARFGLLEPSWCSFVQIYICGEIQIYHVDVRFGHIPGLFESVTKPSRKSIDPIK